MKLRFKKLELINAINIVLKAVPSKTTMSILECILIDALSSEVKLISTDTELGIQTGCAAQIEEAGMIALDAKLFSEIIRKLPADEVDIVLETDEKYQTTITCEKSVFKIPGKDGRDFVSLPQVDRDYSLILSQFTLKNMINQTIFSIALNDSNKMMSGELFEVNDAKLRLVSLDGHRISIRTAELRSQYENIKAIVPGKTLNEISKILSGDMDKEVNIFVSKNHILFEFENTIVVSRLIDGEFFRINQMLSGDYETKITANRRELLESIERSTIFVRENDKKPLIFNIMDREMELKINSGIGAMNAVLDIKKTGKDLMIGFNPKFMMDALRSIEDETVDIYMTNPKSPCFIKDEAGSYIYLILPVNFNAASV